jgi:hypothetical protein
VIATYVEAVVNGAHILLLVKKFLDTNDLVVASECDGKLCEYGGHFHEPGEGHQVVSDIILWEEAFLKFLSS